MRVSLTVTAVLAVAPQALAWGAMGHQAIAYVATNFVSSTTKSYFQSLLGDTSADYLAGVSTWADSYRSTSAGKFSAPFHYIDANDSPPSACGVELARDCGKGGCVVSAIANYVRALCQYHGDPGLTGETDKPAPGQEVEQRPEADRR